MFTDCGFWIARPTQLVKDLWNRTLEVSVKAATPGLEVDQHAFNHVLDTERPTLKFSRHFRPMPRLLYPSGLFFHRLNLNDQSKIYPMVVHVNFLIGNVPKKATLQRYNMWYVGNVFA